MRLILHPAYALMVTLQNMNASRFDSNLKFDPAAGCLIIIFSMQIVTSHIKIRFYNELIYLLFRMLLWLLNCYLDTSIDSDT